ncbi:CARDB domain-containing protein [Natrialbaceae archaeon A-arb3/5]
MTARPLVLVFVVLLVASLPAGVAGVESGPTDGSSIETNGATTADSADEASTAGEADDVLHRTTVLSHLPEQPGTFETEKTFQVPDPVVSLEIDLGPRAEIESIDGFERTSDGSLEWTEATDRPSVRFTMPANRTSDIRHHAGGSNGAAEGVSSATGGSSSGEYTFVDTGEWGIVQIPGIDISLRQTEPVGNEETVRIDGPGAVGDRIAVFGEVTEYQRTVDGETIRLVVPDAAEMDEAPADVLETLADASERLDVGTRGDEVFIVAAPADVDWAPDGLQYGESDAWVVADAPLDDPANIWLHEFVHVRQDYTADTTAETEWLVEAQAEYYAATLALENGLIEFDEFERHLERGEHPPYADAVLSEPTTWTDDRTDYVKGRLAYAEIDRTLRLATDGDRTSADVFRVMNAGEGEFSEAAYLKLLELAGGPDVREVAERYTQTDESPEMWDRSDHRAAFDLEGAAFEYEFGPDPLGAEGELWDLEYELADSNANEIAVPDGATLTVPVTATNAGDRNGTADVVLGVDGSVAGYDQPTLEPGETTTSTFDWTPPKPGEYDLRVDGEQLTVHVRSNASLTVSDIAVAPEEPEPGQLVTVTGTIENEGDRPGAAVFEFRTPDGETTVQPIVLEPGETGTISDEVQFDEDGSYDVAVGERTETVSVSTTPPAELEEVPGFGGVAAIGALLVTLLVVRLRRR